MSTILLLLPLPPGNGKNGEYERRMARIKDLGGGVCIMMCFVQQKITSFKTFSRNPVSNLYSFEDLIYNTNSILYFV